MFSCVCFIGRRGVIVGRGGGSGGCRGGLGGLSASVVWMYEVVLGMGGGMDGRCRDVTE